MQEQKQQGRFWKRWGQDNVKTGEGETVKLDSSLG